MSELGFELKERLGSVGAVSVEHKPEAAGQSLAEFSDSHCSVVAQ